MTPLTVSVADAALLLGVSDDLVYSLVDQGDLPAIQLGRRRVIPRAAIEQVVARAMAGFDPDRTLARIASAA